MLSEHGSEPRKESAPAPTPDAREPLCTDVVGRAYVIPYALERCEAQEAAAFEAHLLTCDVCFRDLQALDRASALLHQFMGSLSPAAERVRSDSEAPRDPSSLESSRTESS